VLFKFIKESKGKLIDDPGDAFEHVIKMFKTPGVTMRMLEGKGIRSITIRKG